MSGIYQLKVNPNTVALPSSDSVFFSIDLNGKLFTVDNSSDIQEYARMSDLSNITGGTYDNITNELTLDNSTGGTIVISGFTTGGTSGFDVFVTGGTYNNITGEATLL